MKTTTERNALDYLRNATATIDPELSKYAGSKLFARKLALAEKHLKGVIIPKVNEQPEQDDFSDSE